MQLLVSQIAHFSPQGRWKCTSSGGSLVLLDSPAATHTLDSCTPTRGATTLSDKFGASRSVQLTVGVLSDAIQRLIALKKKSLNDATTIFNSIDQNPPAQLFWSAALMPEVIAYIMGQLGRSAGMAAAVCQSFHGAVMLSEPHHRLDVIGTGVTSSAAVVCTPRAMLSFELSSHRARVVRMPALKVASIVIAEKATILCTDAGALYHFTAEGAHVLVRGMVGTRAINLAAGTDFVVVSTDSDEVYAFGLTAQRLNADPHMTHMLEMLQQMPDMPDQSAMLQEMLMEQMFEAEGMFGMAAQQHQINQPNTTQPNIGAPAEGAEESPATILMARRVVGLSGRKIISVAASKTYAVLGTSEGTVHLLEWRPTHMGLVHVLEFRDIDGAGVPWRDTKISCVSCITSRSQSSSVRPPVDIVLCSEAATGDQQLFHIHAVPQFAEPEWHRIGPIGKRVEGLTANNTHFFASTADGKVWVVGLQALEKLSEDGIQIELSELLQLPELKVSAVAHASTVRATAAGNQLMVCMPEGKGTQGVFVFKHTDISFDSERIQSYALCTE